jgi:hypothetical protein
MLFVGLFHIDRAKDLEFWAVLWQGQGPPPDFELVAAYNLMTDLRVIVFRAETVQAIRFLDRLNMVGRFSCHPALDQTDGYRAAFARDADGLGEFVRGRGAREEAAQAGVEFRRQAMEQPNLWAAVLLADEWRQRGNRPA